MCFFSNNDHGRGGILKPSLLCSSMESFNSNKLLKEQFVSNLTGSPKLEIFFLVTNLSLLILLRHCIGFNGSTSGSVKKDDDASNTRKNLKAYVLALTIDFLFIPVPYILFVTVLAEWNYGNTIFLVLILLFLRAIKGNQSSLLQEAVDSIREKISSYRVSVMLITCISILAVDFKIFPRKYAKTETYGTGLMDLGVGSFVIANALVSRQARGISNTKNVLYSTAPLILLGAARLISTRSVNYQVHVGEYGVHWNFFFTLAAVTLLTSIINVHPSYCGVLGSSILFGYQLLLSCGLNKYLLSEVRGSNILNQNKEGVFSIFGYWGMYLLGVAIGRYLFFGDSIGAKLKTNNWMRARTWILCIFFWSLNLLLDWYVEKTSRRTCNLAYVCFSLAVSLQVLAIMMMSDYVSGCKSSLLEEAFSRNLLASFLLANILTGLVNLFVDTLSVSPATALCILLAYALVLIFGVGLAEFVGLKLKRW